MTRSCPLGRHRRQRRGGEGHPSVDPERGAQGASTSAADWLLDNHHVADEIFRNLCCDLQLEVCRSLPPLQLPR